MQSGDFEATLPVHSPGPPGALRRKIALEARQPADGGAAAGARGGGAAAGAGGGGAGAAAGGPGAAAAGGSPAKRRRLSGPTPALDEASQPLLFLDQLALSREEGRRRGVHRVRKIGRLNLESEDDEPPAAAEPPAGAQPAAKPPKFSAPPAAAAGWAAKSSRGAPKNTPARESARLKEETGAAPHSGGEGEMAQAAPAPAPPAPPPAAPHAPPAPRPASPAAAAPPSPGTIDSQLFCAPDFDVLSALSTAPGSPWPPATRSADGDTLERSLERSIERSLKRGAGAAQQNVPPSVATAAAAASAAPPDCEPNCPAGGPPGCVPGGDSPGAVLGAPVAACGVPPARVSFHPRNTFVVHELVAVPRTGSDGLVFGRVMAEAAAAGGGGGEGGCAAGADAAGADASTASAGCAGGSDCSPNPPAPALKSDAETFEPGVSATGKWGDFPLPSSLRISLGYSRGEAVQKTLPGVLVGKIRSCDAAAAADAAEELLAVAQLCAPGRLVDAVGPVLRNRARLLRDLLRPRGPKWTREAQPAVAIGAERAGGAPAGEGREKSAGGLRPGPTELRALLKQWSSAQIDAVFAIAGKNW